MQSNIYVAVSGQLSLLKRLETVAQNIANVGTPGYRTERVSFEEILSRSGDASTSFVSEGQTFISKQSGALQDGEPTRCRSQRRRLAGSLTPAGSPTRETVE